MKLLFGYDILNTQNMQNNTWIC